MNKQKRLIGRKIRKLKRNQWVNALNWKIFKRWYVEHLKREPVFKPLSFNDIDTSFGFEEASFIHNHALWRSKMIPYTLGYTLTEVL